MGLICGISENIKLAAGNRGKLRNNNQPPMGQQRKSMYLFIVSIFLITSAPKLSTGMGKNVALSSLEKRLIMKKVAKGMSMRKTAREIHRCPSAASSFLGGRARTGAGRRNKLGKRGENRFLQHIERMQKKADMQFEVTLPLILAKWKGAKISERTAKRIMCRAGIKWRRTLGKPILTPQDIRDRKCFSRKHMRRKSSFWETCVCIDGKFFRLVLNRKHRRWAASQTVRGTYRSLSSKSALEPFRVKRAAKNKVSLGGTVAVIGGVCGPHKKMFWHVVPGRWNAARAVSMYEELSKFLTDNYPQRKKWVLIEGNDPAGFQSKMAIRRKKELGLTPIGMPKRSPDLQPMDYSIWSEINSAMRKSESRMGQRAESKRDHVARLQHTAESLSPDLLRGAQRSLKRRLQMCFKARGYLFRE